MKHKTYIYTFIIAGILLAISCEKAFIEPDHENTPQNNFDYLWKDLDEKYSYFEYKNVNWDSLYWVHRDQISSDMTDRELFDVMAGMLGYLKDGHVNLNAPFDRSRFWEWYLNSPQNFDFSLLERNYLQGDYSISQGNTYLYKQFDDIGYIYVGSFSRSNFSKIDHILQEFSDTKGIILDIRNNGGGSVYNAEILASRFADRTRLYAYWQWKAGPKHDDFTEKVPYYIVQGGNSQYTKNIALLTNRSSFSAANDFTLMMKQLPHVTIIGDTTGGGAGVPYSGELPNGWTYRFSRTLTLSPEGEHVEFGIPPHITAYMDSSSVNRGKDAILEKAFQLLD